MPANINTDMDRPVEFISTYAKTKETIVKHGFHVKKGYGQNFLTDQHVIHKIMEGSLVMPEDLVIEIGPGIGGLTEQLALKAGQVIAIEIDRALIPILEENLAAYDNVEIIHADILKTDIRRLIEDKNALTAKIVANLPYYITTPIIMNILENNLPVASMTVMVQKEVANRIRAEAGSKDYGALTLAVAYRAEASLLANVPRNCFIPRPNVDSAVIRLDILKAPPIQPKDEGLLFGIIRACFEQRRKTIVNCLFNRMDLGFSKEELAGFLTGCGLNPNERGENLDLDSFAALSNRIYDHLH